MTEIVFYVLVPVYKTERYIAACIESVLRQTYQNFFLILVDDGSPDFSGSICDDYAKKDPRITVIHQENKGQLGARNAAIEEMKRTHNDNSFCVFVDSDDKICPNALEKIAEAIKMNNCDMVVYGVDRFNSKFTGIIESKKDLYRLVFSDSGYNSLCRKAVLSNIIAENNYTDLYHVQVGEDLLQSIPLYKSCEKVVFIGDVLYEYTLNPESIMQSISYEKYTVDSTVRSLVWEFLREEDVWDKDDYDFYLRYCRKLLVIEIIRIANFDTSLKNKTVLFDEIYKDNYYHEILNSASYIDIFLKLLCKRAFRTIYILGKIGWMLMPVYHAVKKRKQQRN